MIRRVGRNRPEGSGRVSRVVQSYPQGIAYPKSVPLQGAGRVWKVIKKLPRLEYPRLPVCTYPTKHALVMVQVYMLVLYGVCHST